MKRISCLLLTLSLSGSPVARAQDAATEERLNKLTGQIEDLIAAQKEQKERLAALAREIGNVRDQLNKPTANYAAQEDLKQLADKVKEVDRKRIEDAEKIHAELLKLGKNLSAPPVATRHAAPAKEIETASSEKSASPEKGFEYTIQKNDTLSVIVQAYREKNIKVTTDQILKANPGLNANRLRPGQKIFIPAPSS